jgi:hypothetical protein
MQTEFESAGEIESKKGNGWGAAKITIGAPLERKTFRKI